MRGLRAVAIFAALVAAAFAFVAAGPASAKSCTKDGATKRCVSIHPLKCSTGAPTTCKRSRSECVTGRGGGFRCHYTEELSRCNGFQGKACTRTNTKCDSTRKSKFCTSRTLLSCRAVGATTRCNRGVNSCRTTGSRFHCVNDQTHLQCKAGTCKATRKVCSSGSLNRTNSRQPSCNVTRYTTPDTGYGSNPNAAAQPADTTPDPTTGDPKQDPSASGGGG